MRAINKEFYGDDIRWFVGVIKDINDPEKLGRVRVRVFGIHTHRTDLIQDTDLPWANVILPVTQGGISERTMPTGIRIGAQVFGMFMDGEQSQVPLVLGSIPHNGSKRVPYDGPNDPHIQTTPAIQTYQYAPGDEISSTMASKLEQAGVRPNGQVLTSEQADALNGVYSGSGDVEMSLVGESRAEQIFNFLKEVFQQKGHSNPGIVAAAFVGNFMHEAGRNLDPNINEGKPLVAGSRGGYGLAQWTASRRVDLEKYAAKKNAGVGNIPIQLSFAEWELSNSSSHLYVANYLMNDHTIEAATETVFSWYENPQVSVDFKRENAEAKSWGSYMRGGGIRAFLKRNSRQSSATRAYNLEYSGRLADAKAVFKAVGG